MVLALLGLGRRLRRGAEGRALGIALAYAWLAYPFTLYGLGANTNDALVAVFVLGALILAGSALGRGLMIAAGSAAKFGPLGLAPLFAAGGASAFRDRWRATIPFGIAFVALWAIVLLPLLPDGGLRQFYDTTFGYQASRGSPFSIWGLVPGLADLQSLARLGAIALGAAFFFFPRGERSVVQLTALAAALLIAAQVGSTHWFYFFILWFAPLILVVSFASQEKISGRSSSPADQASAS